MVFMCKLEVDYVQRWFIHDLFQTLSMYDFIAIIYNVGE
jgi:hypothetical protein